MTKHDKRGRPSWRYDKPTRGFFGTDILMRQISLDSQKRQAFLGLSCLASIAGRRCLPDQGGKRYGLRRACRVWFHFSPQTLTEAEQNRVLGQPDWQSSHAGVHDFLIASYTTSGDAIPVTSCIQDRRVSSGETRRYWLRPIELAIGQRRPFPGHRAGEPRASGSEIPMA